MWKKYFLAKVNASAFVCLSAIVLASCTHPLPTNYAPSSVMSANGAVSVSDFRYLPAERPKDPLPPNKIHNTAMGEVLLDRDVKQYVRDGVFAELRFVGIKMNDPRRVLTGDIEEFLIDDLGYSVDWTLRIKYTVRDPEKNAPVYESVKNTQRRTAKFANAFGGLNETVKLSVEELLKDNAFLKAIDANQ